ncbi:hypothetical protein [Sinorhizobium fredii]|uniref:hypothetical protein n=1 Tax=Rhizobium fredii TaxID=380 RepID=UPI0004B9588C|nr:hypothetical protein [Sinorhizobium fredii]UTY48549.1 hypothetical protein EPK84_18100 [Sinorhizobium fredii]
MMTVDRDFANDNELLVEAWAFTGTPEEIASNLLAWLRAAPRRSLSGVMRIRLGELTIFDEGEPDDLSSEGTVWCDTLPGWTDFEARHLAIIVRLHRDAFLEVLSGRGWRDFSNGNRFEEAMERVRARIAPRYAF